MDNSQHTVKCHSGKHGYSGSKINANEIPIEGMYKNGKDESKGLFRTCLDCRSYQKRMARRRIYSRMQAEQQNKQADNKCTRFFCESCRYVRFEDERAIDKNGKPTIVCVTCQELI